MICIFSHFAIESRTLLDISDYGFEMESNWSFGGMVYSRARCLIDSCTFKVPPLCPRLAISQLYKTAFHGRDYNNRRLKAIIWRLKGCDPPNSWPNNQLDHTPPNFILPPARVPSLRLLCSPPYI